MSLTGALVVVAPQGALACSCVPPPPDEVAIERSDAVFSGTVTEARDPQKGAPVVSSGGAVFYTMEVDTVVKGQVDATEEVRTALSSASCGYRFREGKRYLVFAMEHERSGDPTVSLCSNTRPVSDSETIEGEPAEEEPSERTPGWAVGPPLEDDERSVPVGALAGAGVAAALLAVVAYRMGWGRPRRRSS
ncbi:MAG TPA: hypothetical protein VFS18_04070 [Actinomycetota bacterium]|nr:hypothetical protein [Actinomycetota bacterium]